jgi:hypothetical protein
MVSTPPVAQFGTSAVTASELRAAAIASADYCEGDRTTGERSGPSVPWRADREDRLASEVPLLGTVPLFQRFRRSPVGLRPAWDRSVVDT